MIEFVDDEQKKEVFYCPRCCKVVVEQEYEYCEKCKEEERIEYMSSNKFGEMVRKMFNEYGDKSFEIYGGVATLCFKGSNEKLQKLSKMLDLRGVKNNFSGNYLFIDQETAWEG